MKRFGMFVLTMMLAAGAATGCPRSAFAAQPMARMAAAKEGFYLKDGDRVVFYGDSITDQRLYTTYIETYCLTRFPTRRFTFIHSGWGGDRVTGGGGGPIDVRLRRDVLVYKPSVVTICLGMNDGGYRAFDPGLFNTYVTGYRHILDTLRKELPSVRITLLTAPAFDDVTRAAGFPGGYNATLIAYGEAVKQLGHTYGLTVADTNAPLIAALARAQTANTTLAARIIPDRVHPQSGGHLVMAAAVLKAWNAPDVVADIEVNGADGQVVRQENTRLSNVRANAQGLQFTAADNVLPWPIDRDPDKNQDTILTLSVTDIEQTLNLYRLRVTNLSSAKYALKADGQEVGTFSREELQNGIDLAALPNLPANVQAQEVLALTRKHNDLHFKRWRVVQVPHATNGDQVSADTKKEMDDLDAQEAEAVRQLRAALRPRLHTLELVTVN
jgi:lysophospholipase L1-like esterase